LTTFITSVIIDTSRNKQGYHNMAYFAVDKCGTETVHNSEPELNCGFWVTYRFDGEEYEIDHGVELSTGTIEKLSPGLVLTADDEPVWL
jgi:hypothetical protein